MPKFERKSQVLITSQTTYKGLKGKQVTVSDIEQRADGFYYLVAVKGKEYWIPEEHLS